MVLAPAHPAQAMVARLCGSAINQDGQSSGLTAPNGPSQAKLLLMAARGGNLPVSGLQFLASHGTGTALGDPIEVGAVGQAMIGSNIRFRTSNVVLGSVKSCYGHTEGSAGIAGLFMAAKVASQHCVPASMHLRNMNPYVEAALGDWHRSLRFAAGLPRQTAPAIRDDATFAGCSSFGMSGVNAHAVVQRPLFGDGARQDGPRCAVWDRQRAWPLVPVHPLLQSGLIYLNERKATLSSALTSSEGTRLLDYQVQGHALMPEAALLELIVAAGRTLSGEETDMALTNGMLRRPVHCSAGSTFECCVHYGSGAVHIVSSLDVVAEASIGCMLWGEGIQAATGLPSARAISPWAADGSSANPGATALAVGMAMYPEQDSTYVAVHAAWCLSDHQHAHMIVGCQQYALGGKGSSKARPARAFSSGQHATLLLGDDVPMLQLQSLTTRQLAWVLPGRASKTPRATSWQIQLQPARYLTVSPQRPRPCIIFATQPCLMSSLSSLSSFDHGVWHAALSAVWCDRPATNISASGLPCCSELSLGTDAQLELLFHSSEPNQLCYLVQQPGSPVDMSMALATYRAVAQSAVNVKLSLITFDQCGGHGASRNTSVALLQGKPTLCAAFMLAWTS